MLAKQNPVFEDASNTYYELIQDPLVRADYEMLERDRAHQRNREKLVVELSDTVKEQADTVKEQADTVKEQADTIKKLADEIEALKAELAKHQKS